MNSFEFFLPTKIIFGKNAEENTGIEIKKLGKSRAFILHMDIAVTTGVLNKVIKSLEESGVEYLTHSGVQPNPRLQFAVDAVKKAKNFNADFILAVGGGSVIDTAKAVAHGVANTDTNIWEFWTGKKIEQSTPIGVVLTIAASGSETSESAVLTNEEEKYKKGIDSPYNRPQFAIMNPEFTYTLPKFQIACGIVDMMMHTMDRYFAKNTDNDLTNAIAEALLRTVIKNAKPALENSSDYHAMSELMWCASLSHSGITGLGAKIDFAPHALARELGAFYDLPHGAALSSIWASWARYCLEENLCRFARFANEVWGIHAHNDREAAVMAIDKTEEMFTELGMPVTFSQLGIGVKANEELKAMAYSCSEKGKRLVGTFKELTQEDLFNIYSMANK